MRIVLNLYILIFKLDAYSFILNLPNLLNDKLIGYNYLFMATKTMVFMLDIEGIVIKLPKI